jgi:hypothetical protein
VHYLIPNQKAAATPRETATLPLDQNGLEQVLAE